MQQPRDYRSRVRSDLELSRLVVGETDLAVHLPPGVWDAALEKRLRDKLVEQRSLLLAYLAADPGFAAAHRPYQPAGHAPRIARRMAAAAAQAGVGPMAAVAGMFAMLAGQVLAAASENMIIENGGDIYLAGSEARVVGVYAGPHSPFSDKLGVRLAPALFPCGVCTSSGTLGSSFSYGVADAAVVVAGDAALADAAATATANLVHSPADVGAACAFAMAVPGVRAALVLCRDALAAAGELELAPLTSI